MAVIKCSRIWVKDKRRRQVLSWRKPLFGTLTVQNEGRRLYIKKRGLFGFGVKTYFPTETEVIETDQFWWDIF